MLKSDKYGSLPKHVCGRDAVVTLVYTFSTFAVAKTLDVTAERHSCIVLFVSCTQPKS